MRRYVYITFILFTMVGYAQTALYNSGNIRIHDEGQLGFHTDLINNASFDQNLGLAGFYGSNMISVSGAFMPVFYDTEIANPNGVFLNTGMNVTNNTNFVLGNVITPKNQPDLYYNFFRDAFTVGESDLSKVDGYAAITDKRNFAFPVGDSEQLRPLILNSNAVNALAKCAYFFDNPNNPSTFSINFNTDTKASDLSLISTTEFWRLQSTVNSNITLSWNERSNMAALATDLIEITIVGWNKATDRWIDLGNVSLGGDLSQGFVTSTTFLPSEYEIITLGSLLDPLGILTFPTDVPSLDNFIVTPNNDGINDVLVIPGMELSPINTIQIFNRAGLKVFEQANYTNEFNGTSNVGDLVINRNAGLPQGVYFYIVYLADLDLNYQGFLYLNR